MSPSWATTAARAAPAARPQTLTLTEPTSMPTALNGWVLVWPAMEVEPSQAGQAGPPGSARGTLDWSIAPAQRTVRGPAAGPSGHMIQRDEPRPGSEPAELRTGRIMQEACAV